MDEEKMMLEAPLLAETSFDASQTEDGLRMD